MGVKKLGTLINRRAPQCMVIRRYSDYRSTRQAIDGNMQIYRFVIAIRGTNSGEDLKTSHGKLTSHIFGVFNKVLNALKYGIETVWVFDGQPPDIKRLVLKERKRVKVTAKKRLSSGKYNSEKEKIKLMKRTYCIRNTHIEEVQKLLNLMGIPYIQAIGEAEAQCAVLTTSGKTDGVVTEDWDALPFGSMKMLKDFSNKKNVKEIDLNKLLNELNLTLSEFIDVCILLGTDYCPGIKGMSPLQIYDEYKRCGGTINLLKMLRTTNAELISCGKDPRFIIPPNFKELWESIKDYYLNVVVLDPNDPAMKLEWKKPDVSGLIDFLCRDFEFNREKTMKKIEMMMSIYDQYQKNGVLRGLHRNGSSQYMPFQRRRYRRNINYHKNNNGEDRTSWKHNSFKCCVKRENCEVCVPA